MSSLMSHIMRPVVRHVFQPRLKHNSSFDESARRFQQVGMLMRPVPSARYEIVDADGVVSHYVTMPESEPGRVLLYLHGGGYVIGGMETYHDFVARLAQLSRSTLLFPAYRLATEHPYPAALDDAETAYDYLLSVGFAPSQIAVVGDSAGGGLAVSLMLRLRERGKPLPAALWCLSPWVDLTCSGDSHRERAAHEVILSTPWLQRAAAAYANGCNLHALSSVYADLSGLPPTLVQVGTREILFSDSERLAEQARLGGVEVTLEVWPGMWHVFHTAASAVPEARWAVENGAQFVCQHIG